MKITTTFFYLIIGLLLPAKIFSQNKYDKIRTELSSWDPVRGLWLANSYEALEKGNAIPVRMFAEDLTPSEVFQLAPEQTKKSIFEILSNSPQATVSYGSVPAQAPSVNANGFTRKSLDSSPETAPRVVSSTGNFNGIFNNANCQLVQGRSYGDPHIRTFDGSTFSFQTVGEYVLASSRNGDFVVQGRQKAESDKVSMNGAVAMNVAGDRVGIYAQDNPSRDQSPLRVNGQQVSLSNSTYFLSSGGTIQQNGRKYIITWPTGERVQADIIQSSGRSFVNLSIYVYNCYGDYSGILGNANGSRTDDFNVNGRSFNNSLVFDPFDTRKFDSQTAFAEREQLRYLSNDFGSQYLVNTQNTLFEYANGANTWTYYNPNFPSTHLTLNDISSTQRERARQECIRQGIAREELSACIMDLSHANIQPTPQISTPDRVTGRTFTPVTEPRVNGNRADAGGGEGYRRPWGENCVDGSTRQPSSTIERKPIDGNTRINGVDNTRTINTNEGNTRTTAPISTRTSEVKNTSEPQINTNFKRETTSPSTRGTETPSKTINFDNKNTDVNTRSTTTQPSINPGGNSGGLRAPAQPTKKVETTTKENNTQQTRGNY